MSMLSTGTDGRTRCAWGASTPDYEVYHDTEWGFPVGDDRLLFEKLCLEGFQSGLSWLTILRKRDNFRRAFHAFDPDAVAKMGPGDVELLLQDEGIIRHRGKIEATINNACKVPALRDEFGSLAAYLWSYEPASADPDRATSPESIALSKDLKRRGFKFVGPTTVYAFMQAMGLVNDHRDGCFVFAAAQAARSGFEVPMV